MRHTDGVPVLPCLARLALVESRYPFPFLPTPPPLMDLRLGQPGAYWPANADELQRVLTPHAWTVRLRAMYNADEHITCTCHGDTVCPRCPRFVLTTMTIALKTSLDEQALASAYSKHEKPNVTYSYGTAGFRTKYVYGA